MVGGSAQLSLWPPESRGEEQFQTETGKGQYTHSI